MRLARLFFAYLLAVAAAEALIAVFHMQFVLAGLQALGVEIGLYDRLRATLIAMRGFIPTLGPVIATGFAIAFPTAALLKRAPPLRPLAPVAYPLAAAAAMATAIALMNLEYETTPLASTRTPLGFAALCAAAAAAGWLFARAKGSIGWAAVALDLRAAAGRFLPSRSRPATPVRPRPLPTGEV